MDVDNNKKYFPLLTRLLRTPAKNNPLIFSWPSAHMSWFDVPEDNQPAVPTSRRSFSPSSPVGIHLGELLKLSIPFVNDLISISEAVVSLPSMFQCFGEKHTFFTAEALNK